MENKVTIKNIVFRYSLSIIIIMFFVVMGMLYVSQSARDIVFMDCWRKSVRLIPDVMEGTISLGDFWKNDFGQRNSFELILLAFNIRYFGLNCLIESYLGMLVIGVSSLMLFIKWEHIENVKPTGMVKRQVLFLPIVLALFNLNQWEILSLQFSFCFMTRIAMFLSVFIVLDNLMVGQEWRPLSFCKCGVYAGVIICFLSQLYFPAMLMAVLFGFAFSFRTTNFNWLKKVKGYIAFLVPCTIAILIYFWGIPATDMGGGSESFANMLLDGSFFIGILYMFASSVLPQTILQQMSEMQIILVGLGLVIVVLIAVFLYFYLQMYKNTFLPVMITAYGVCSIPIIIYGRASQFDLFYLTSSRYTCETTLIWVGCLLVFANAIVSCGRFFGLNIKKKICSLLACACMLTLSFLILQADIEEYRIAPFRGANKDILIDTLKSKERVDDETLALLQSPVDTVRQGIDLLKKYDLNIYRYNEYEVGDENLADDKFNVFEDGWVGPDASMHFMTGDSGKVLVEIYDPFWEQHVGGISKIFVNDVPIIEIEVKQNNYIELSLKENHEYEICFESDYYVDEPAPGERKLCFVMKLECLEGDENDE